MQIDRSILNNHRQLYRTSCVPSTVEMLLKIEGIIDPSSFMLQEKYGDNNPRSGDDFDNKCFPGTNKTIKFHKVLLPCLEQIFARIDSELNAGRCVLIPLKTSEEGQPWMCHQHILYDFSPTGEYKTFTRLFGFADIIPIDNARTRFINNFKEMESRPIDSRNGTDFLTYERL